MMARRVDEVARPFAGDRDFERQRAIAWCWVCWALRMDRQRSEMIARRVDDIVRPFAGDSDFEYLRAATWDFVGKLEHAHPNGVISRGGPIAPSNVPFSPTARDSGHRGEE
jgi:hypothetical protein